MQNGLNSDHEIKLEIATQTSGQNLNQQQTHRIC